MPSVLDASALTTLSNLKDMVGIASADTSKDNHLERCINRATWLIEDMTGRKFSDSTTGGFKARRYNGGTSTHATTGVPDEDYIYFSGALKQYGGETLMDERGYGLFYLPAFPVQANSVLTFYLDVLNSRASGTGEVWDTGTYVEFDNFIVDRPNGVLRLLSGPFPPGNKNLRVTMAAGYQYGSAQPFVPPDLEALCIEFAKGIYRDNRTVQSESIGTWSRAYDTQKEDPLVQQTIARYLRPAL